MGCVGNLGNNTGFVTEQPEMGNQAMILSLKNFLKISCLAAPNVTSSYVFAGVLFVQIHSG